MRHHRSPGPRLLATALGALAIVTLAAPAWAAPAAGGRGNTLPTIPTVTVPPLPTLPEITVPTTLPLAGEITVPTLPGATVPTTLPALPAVTVPTVPGSSGVTVPGGGGSAATTAPDGDPTVSANDPMLEVPNIPADITALIALLDGIVGDVTALTGEACQTGDGRLTATVDIDDLLRVAAGANVSPSELRAEVSLAASLLGREVVDVADVISLRSISERLTGLDATAKIDLRTLDRYLAELVPNPSGAGVRLCNASAGSGSTSHRALAATPNADDGSGDGGGLPFTGANAVALALVGGGLVAGGWFLKRRARTNTSAGST